MGEFTQCNYCSFEQLKKRAKRDGKVVTVKRSTFELGGSEVYVHKKGEVLSKQNWVAWMMLIPTQCEC